MAKKFENNVNEKNLILTRAQGAVISRDFPTAARLYKQLLKDIAGGSTELCRICESLELTYLFLETYCEHIELLAYAGR